MYKVNNLVSVILDLSIILMSGYEQFFIFDKSYEIFYQILY